MERPCTSSFSQCLGAGHVFKASSLSCPDLNDYWEDILALLPPETMSRSKVLLAQHVDWFDTNRAVYTHCRRCILDAFCFLQGCLLCVTAPVQTPIALQLCITGTYKAAQRPVQCSVATNVKHSLTRRCYTCTDTCCCLTMSHRDI
jgi:hypothetical protein